MHLFRIPLCNHSREPNTTTDLIHNTPIPYPTMQHSEQKSAHFCSELCIVGCGTGVLWDLWDWSIVNVSCPTLPPQLPNSLLTAYANEDLSLTLPSQLPNASLTAYANTNASLTTPQLPNSFFQLICKLSHLHGKFAVSSHSSRLFLAWGTLSKRNRQLVFSYSVYQTWQLFFKEFMSNDTRFFVNSWQWLTMINISWQMSWMASTPHPPYCEYIDGSVQERRNSITNALELRLSCTNPSIWCQTNFHVISWKYWFNWRKANPKVHGIPWNFIWRQIFVISLVEWNWLPMNLAQGK